jgi:hypothetical protein
MQKQTRQSTSPEDLNALLDAYQVDASVKRILDLFPRQTARALLVALLGSAQRRQRIPGGIQVAVVETGGRLVNVARSIGMSKDTFLRYISVLCCIGLLQYIHDELHFPLVPYQQTETVIRDLDRLIACAPRRKLQTLASGVRDRYQAAFGFAAVPPGTQDEAKALLRDAQARLQKQRLSQVDRQVLRLQIDRLLALQGDLKETALGTEQPQLDRQQKGDHSDSFEAPIQQVSLSLGRHHDTCAPYRDGRLDLQGDEVQKGDLKALPMPPGFQVSLCLQQHDIREHGGDEANVDRHSDNARKGDLQGDACSSIESLSFSALTQEKNLDLEATLDQGTESSWSGSEEELFHETLDYLTILDGPPFADATYLATDEGQRHFSGIKNCLQQNPRIARRSGINTLLQLHWPRNVEKYGRLERAGKWFHRSFHLYLHPTRPLALQPEIVAWEQSPYTLQEIAYILQQERQRQEYDWQSGQGLHRPFPMCVETYGYTRQAQHASPSSTQEGDQESNFSPEVREQGRIQEALERQQVENDAATRELLQPEKHSVVQVGSAPLGQHMVVRRRGMSIEQGYDLAREVKRQVGRACLRIGLYKRDEISDQAILKVQLEGERRPIILQHAGQWERYWQWYQQGMRNGCFSSTGVQQGDPAKIPVLVRGV